MVHKSSPRRRPVRRLSTLATAALAVALLGACGGGSPPPETLAAVKDRLVKGGIDCPDAPRDHESGAFNVTVGETPDQELDCTDGNVDITVASFATDSDIESTKNAYMQVGCAFGVKDYGIVTAEKWLLEVEDQNEGADGLTYTDDAKATLKKAGDALGVSPNHAKC